LKKPIRKKNNRERKRRVGRAERKARQLREEEEERRVEEFRKADIEKSLLTFAPERREMVRRMMERGSSFA
jgi:hypothetical protein